MENKVTLVGECLKCDVVLPSGNKYPKKVVEKAIKEYKKVIEEGRALGYTINPDTNIEFQRVMGEASHKITKVEIKEDGKVFAEAELLNTPQGRVDQEIVKQFIDKDIPMKMGIYGFGDLNGYKEILNFEIKSIDLCESTDSIMPYPTVKVKKNKKLF